MSLVIARTGTVDIAAIEELLHLFRQQKAELKARQRALASTKAELEQALGMEEACAIAGLGEVRRIPAGETITWNTKKLNALQAALLLIGEDKMAAEIAAARKTNVRQGYVQVKLAGETDDNDG